MAGTVLCEPSELYNILNQCHVTRHMPRVAEMNYLCLIDAREKTDYYTSHIVTAKNAKRTPDGRFLLPEGVEVDTMRYLVVYDGDTSSLQHLGGATDCAEVLAKVSRCPVRVLKGGYQKFSAMFPFFRTTKIMYTIMELENVKPYPVEVLAGLLYMGDHRQAADDTITADLKIRSVVNVSQTSTLECKKGSPSILNVHVADSVMADLFSSFERICVFIGSHLNMGSPVLVFSRHGVSRCSAVTMAFLIHHLKYSLEEAWQHVLKCKSNMRPNRGFVQQLSDWELHTTGRRQTDTSEPNF